MNITMCIKGGGLASAKRSIDNIKVAKEFYSIRLKCKKMTVWDIRYKSE